MADRVRFLDELRTYLEGAAFPPPPPDLPAHREQPQDDPAPSAHEPGHDLRRWTVEIPRYAIEIRAVRHFGNELERTPIGRIAMELPVRDAIRWLLAVETVQALGPDDPWRLSSEAARALLTRGRWTTSGGGGDQAPLPTSRSTLERLERLGLLRREKDLGQGSTTWTILPHAQPLLKEVAAERSAPFQILAEALLQDETARVLEPALAVERRFQAEAIATATGRHARMVAHEIRNALVPVGEALDDLYDAITGGGQGQLLQPHRDTIDTGVNRIFAFLKDIVRIAELAKPTTETFPVVAAITDAIAVILRDLGQTVDFEPPSARPNVIGNRSRFTLAMVNLLRNASQSRAGREVHVSVTVAREGGTLTIFVDDDGPGVPPEHHLDVFRPGFSLRPGGAGEGLALVREVIEKEMGGRAACSESPQGGARFVLSVPAREGARS